MSKRIAIVALVLLLAIAGAVTYILLQSQSPAMTDGPGMLYFYSPV